MYYSYFGLTQPPFRLTPDTEFFYGGANRGPILEALIYAVRQGEGIIKVTGEVGSGKTMLCSMLQARLAAGVDTAYIVNPSVSPVEILAAIALELQLTVPRHASHLQLMQIVHRHLLERHAQRRQVVMFVEESQNMPIATLEEIRLLSNLETANSKLLQIVLFGQPEFDDTLRQPNIRQLRERISYSFHLHPLKRNEIRDYLNFRLHTAGYRGPELFTGTVLRTIERASQGLTRRVNLIADKALLAAFSENTHAVRPRHVKAAIQDCEFGCPKPLRLPLRIAATLALVAIGGGIGSALYAAIRAYQQWAPLPIAEQRTAPVSAATTLTAATPASKPISGAISDNISVLPSPALAVAMAPQRPVSPDVTPRVRFPSSDQPELLETRLAATQIWLTEQDRSVYSIQILGTNDPRKLGRHLDLMKGHLKVEDLFVYRTVANRKPSLTLLYGSFNDRRAAQEGLARLPAALKISRPILRTVQGIRAEIAQIPPSVDEQSTTRTGGHVTKAE